MGINSLGDLGQGYMLRGRNASLKSDIQRLTAELTTGQIADVRGQLAGNYSFLTDVERKVAVLGNYDIAIKESSQFAGSMQQALDNFSSLSQQLSSTLSSAGTSSVGASTMDVAADARATLDGMLSSLNSSFAGRSLFAGSATDQPALLDGDALIASLTAAIAGATTPNDMMALAESWFDAPSGFDAVAYQGGSKPLSSFAVSTSDSVQIDVRANDPNFKQALRAAAVVSLSADPAFGLSETDQAQLFSLAGHEMLTGQDKIVELQARVGFAEARIDMISSRNAAEVTSLNLARNTLLEADPFKAATELEEVQFQLQSLYSVTVRMSQLSLLNYL